MVEELFASWFLGRHGWLITADLDAELIQLRPLGRYASMVQLEERRPHMIMNILNPAIADERCFCGTGLHSPAV